MNTEQIKKFQHIILNSKNIVFFGGAGVSTESGIPDFRSTDGIYDQKWNYPPETILSHDFFISHTKDFFQFYREKMLYLDAKPNGAHKKLAQLEDDGRLKAIITQNIDGLHQLAGSIKVLELHGSVHRNYCQNCKKCFDALYVLNSQSIPRCNCGGLVKPDVVLYQEGLNPDVLRQSAEAISHADTLIVGGTSLGVYPAAGLINYYGGNQLILINKSPTPFDHAANLLISGSIGEIFSQIL